MAVWNFIKSLFWPKDMARHRFMPILVAICLFVCSTYLLLLPARYYYLHNVSKLVDKDNLYYLQSIRDIEKFAPSNPDIQEFTEELSSFGLRTNTSSKKAYKIEASNLGLFEITTSSDYLGYIEKKDGNYYYNGVDTTIVVSDTAKDLPTITSLDNKFVIDNVNTKAINYDGLTAGEEIKVIKISLVSSNSHFEIDGLDSGISSTSGKVDVTLDAGKLVVNGITTDTVLVAKTIIYFEARTTTYYERDIKFVSDSGVTQNIKIIIDLTKDYIQSSPYTVDSYEVDYLNQDYYFILIYNSAVFYQANLVGINDKNVERSGSKLLCQGYNTFVNKLPFDLSNVESSDIPSYLYDYLINGYTSLAISNFSIISLIYVVGFTFVISLLFSFLFRKTGRMKKFKEFYNIASIANIVPVIITFVVMWFNPSLFGVVYISTFAIYYLFILYKINSSSEIV